MKINRALKIIDEGWVKKPKGFRVHFQKITHSDITTDYVPEIDATPFDSAVTAWRTAWKLFQSTKSKNPEFDGAEMVNIYVVDDSGNPIAYYATNQFEVYNKREIEKS
jgi:hypothetical protein